MMRFFAHESCGQCTPCRNGTAKASVLIDAPEWDLPLLADLSQVMRDASICGLGQAAPNPVDCVIKYFPHELGEKGEWQAAAALAAEADAAPPKPQKELP
jgi:formate dehydrogenase